MSRSSSLASYVSRPVIIPFQKRTFINFFLPRNLLQRNRRAGSEFINQKQQNKSRPKKNDQSLALAKNLSKLLRVSGAFKIENDESFKNTKLFKFFCPTPKKSRHDPRSHILKRALPAFEDRATAPVVRPSLNYAVMQYLLSTKNKMNFDPVLALNNFAAPGVLEPTTKISNAEYGKGKSFDKRIRSRIAFFPY